MKHYLMVFVSSLLAGCCIVFGATCYLTCASQGSYALKIVGSFMFGIGLFTIIHFKLWLYTGKAGYVLDNNKKYLIDLLICLIGNLIGVILLSLLLKSTPIISDSIKALCKTLVTNKQNEKWWQVLILGAMCGVMIYLAVEGHKKVEYPLGKVLFAFMPISLFILCGFEHVVANACYYTYAGLFNGKVILWFILMAIGNAVGSIAFDGIIKLITCLNKTKSE
ncbi:MAG: formate/nitrite transporter family protein [Anaeroplasmataceae bacterium]